MEAVAWPRRSWWASGTVRVPANRGPARATGVQLLGAIDGIANVKIDWSSRPRRAAARVGVHLHDRRISGRVRLQADVPDAPLWGNGSQPRPYEPRAQTQTRPITQAARRSTLLLHARPPDAGLTLTPSASRPCSRTRPTGFVFRVANRGTATATGVVLATAVGVLARDDPMANRLYVLGHVECDRLQHWHTWPGRIVEAHSGIYRAQPRPRTAIGTVTAATAGPSLKTTLQTPSLSWSRRRLSRRPTGVRPLVSDRLHPAAARSGL